MRSLQSHMTLTSCWHEGDSYFFSSLVFASSLSFSPFTSSLPLFFSSLFLTTSLCIWVFIHLNYLSLFTTLSSLELFYYFVSFCPLSRGTAACGLAALLAAIVASGDTIDSPIPHKKQLDWEAIFADSCAEVIQLLLFSFLIWYCIHYLVMWRKIVCFCRIGNEAPWSNCAALS